MAPQRESHGAAGSEVTSPSAGNHMSRLLAAVYDLWMRPTEAACLSEWRAKLLATASGDVLEVGAGTGANLDHYPKALSQLVLAEPDAYMRQRLSKRCGAHGGLRVEVVDAGLEKLPMADESFDVVVSTLVLCSVPSVEQALAQVFRVLRPGGRFYFLEHVAADSTAAFAWQRRVEPLWRFVAGKRHVTRSTERAIEAAGFEFDVIQREPLRRAVPFIRPSIRGVARKVGRGHLRP